MTKAYFTLGTALVYAVVLILILTLNNCGSSGEGFIVKQTQGANGISSLIQMDYSDFDKDICKSTYGVIISTGRDTNTSGTLETQEIESTKILCSGYNGEDAPISDLTIIEIIDPCGDALGILDEILLRLSDGRLIASLSDKVNGRNTRLSIIPEGDYETTDGSHCLFSVLSDNSVVW